jgi:hypothetical protein
MLEFNQRIKMYLDIVHFVLYKDIWTLDTGHPGIGHL